MSLPHEEITGVDGLTSAQELSVRPSIISEVQVGEIARADQQLVYLLDQRLEAALAADEQKDQLGMPVLAPRREMAVAAQACEENNRRGGVLDNPDIYQWYTNIMHATRKQQLLARKARGSITRDEQYILNQVSGTTDPVEGLPTMTTQKITDEMDELAARELLANIRARIDGLDAEIIGQLVQRQRVVIALAGMVSAEQILGFIQAERNSMSGSRLDTPDLLNLFSNIIRGMRRRKLDITEPNA